MNVRFTRWSAVASLTAAAIVACAPDERSGDELVTTPGTPAPQVAAPTTDPSAATPSGACEDLGALAGASLSASFGDDATTQATAFTIGGRPSVTKARVIAYGDPADLVGKPAVLGADVNANLSTCSHCLIVAVGCGADCSSAAWFFARAGKATFTALATRPGEAFTGTFEDVTLEQVSVDMTTLQSTPVPGGGCLRVPSLTFAATAGTAPDGGAALDGGIDAAGSSTGDGGSGGGGGGKGKVIVTRF